MVSGFSKFRRPTVDYELFLGIGTVLSLHLVRAMVRSIDVANDTFAGVPMIFEKICKKLQWLPRVDRNSVNGCANSTIS